MTHPLALKRVIGFVVPAWNASRWIKETLKSLLAQTSDCWRAIVVDDGSTDDTGDQVDRFRRTHRLADDRIWLTRVQHGGLAKAVNAGIRQLGGHVDCLACVGADDHVSEHYVERLLAPFTNPAVLATFPRVIEFGMRIKEWHPGPYKPGLLADVVTGFEGVVVARVEYLTGCTQLCLLPAVNKAGKSEDGHYFDDMRVEVIGGPVRLPAHAVVSPAGCDIHPDRPGAR